MTDETRARNIATEIEKIIAVNLSVQERELLAGRILPVLATIRAEAEGIERARCVSIAESMNEYGVSGRQIAAAIEGTP